MPRGTPGHHRALIPGSWPGTCACAGPCDPPHVTAPPSRVAKPAPRFRLSIRAKLVVAFTALATIPTLLAASYAAVSEHDALTDAARRQIGLELDSASGHFAHHIEQIAGDAAVLAERVSYVVAVHGGQVPAPARATIEDLFARLAAAHANYDQVRLLGADGLELARVNRRGGRVEVVPPGELQDKSSRYYFHQAMAVGRDRTYLSPLDLNVEHGLVEDGTRGVFRVARRVGGSGVVIIDVDASWALRLLDGLRPSCSADILLVSWTGDVAETACDEETCRLVPASLFAADSPFDPAFRRRLLAGERAVMEPHGDQLVSFAPVVGGVGFGAPRWSVVLRHPADVVTGPARDLVLRLAAFAAAILLLAILLGLLAARRLTAPIRRILRYVRRVEAGEPLEPLDVRTGDEVEDLGAGVTEMARRLVTAQEAALASNERLQAAVDEQVGEIADLLETNRAREEEVRRADQLASIGLLSATMAHEVASPLAGMKAAVEVQLDLEIFDNFAADLRVYLQEGQDTSRGIHGLQFPDPAGAECPQVGTRNSLRSRLWPMRGLEHSPENVAAVNGAGRSLSAGSPGNIVIAGRGLIRAIRLETLTYAGLRPAMFVAAVEVEPSRHLHLAYS